jgi:hypothetical protein
VSGLSTLPAALLAHAAAGPEEPWLFHAEGWDWRWLPWRAGAAGVAVWARALAAALPAGTRAGFSYVARPAAVALDLAVQAAGLVAAPVAGGPEMATARGCSAWVEEEGPPPEPLPAGLERVRLPAWRLSPPTPGQGGEGPAARAAGGVVVETSAGSVELTQERLLAAARQIGASVEPGAVAGRREILVAARPLAEPGERAMLAWAVMAGAAVVLEPTPAHLAATATWARPTLFHGTAADLVRLRHAAGLGRRRRWLPRPAPPWGRLRAVFLCGEEPLPPAEEAFWRERAVRVERVPGFA